MDKRNNIPQHWQLKTLAEVCSLVTDGTHKTPNYTKKGVRFISIANIRPFLPITFDKYEKYISEFEHRELLKRARTEKDDILFPRIGTLGYAKRVDWDFDFSIFVGLGLAKPIKDKIYPKYLEYYMNTQEVYRYSVNNANGSGRLTLPLAASRNMPIPLPSIVEQNAIVGKIEELFSELDNGIAQLKTAQQQLKVYRQSLLKAAFEGRLTNENVIEGELPKNWNWVKSGDLFDYVTSGSRGWAKYYAEEGAIFLRITNLDFDTLELDLEESKIQHVNLPSNSEGIRTKVQEGDFLFSITGYLGMFAIAPKLENAYVNQHIALCRPKDNFNKKYVGYWIISKTGGNYHLNKMTKGATKAGLGLEDIKNFPVPLAPFEQQSQIVSLLDNKLTVCDKIEETINNNLQQADTLRQSILKKAFEGKLVNVKEEKQQAKVVSIYKPQNEYFYQVQILALIAKASKEKGIGHGEMTLAKYAYLADKIYDIPTYYNFQRWHLGPYPPEIKKAINNKKFFTKVNKQIELVDEESLLKYNNPYREQIELGINELTNIFSKYKSKDRGHETELLATVCKVVEDIQLTDLKSVRKSMAEWKIELKGEKYKTKAEKFTEAETKSCLLFLIEKGWDKKLLKQ